MILITTTSDDKPELERIAGLLVEQKLAACCQISGPVTSFYTWQDKLETSQEWVCSIKTLSTKFKQIRDLITEHHHYDVPQIVAVETCNASARYAVWVDAMVGKD
ncbi:MAG: periplasmic divalent cation tolerance protein [Mariniblastus sp.]|jgi:periplasmic divalent cation tolerance protein